MPTNANETLQERYQREHQVELDLCRLMTPEQIFNLKAQLHNAEAANDKMLAALREITATKPSAAAPKLRRVIDIAARAIKEVTP